MGLDVTQAIPETDKSNDAANGIYLYDRGYKWLIVIAGSLVILFIGGGLTAGSIRHELNPRIIALGVIELLAFVAAIVYVALRSMRTLQINEEGIFIRDQQGNEINGIRWTELGRVTERRIMGRLALWDQSGTQRVLVDQQFKPFTKIRARILDEYARVFTPRPLPVEFRNSHPFNYTSILLAAGTAFFAVFAWEANQANEKIPALELVGFTVLSFIAFLTMFPGLRGPSVLFDDRLVLRSLFRTRELYRNEIAGVELKDLARGSTKYSFVSVRTAVGKEVKITFLYGDIPEIYLTLRAWLAR